MKTVPYVRNRTSAYIARVALIALSLGAFQVPARAEVSLLQPTQSLPKPASPTYKYFGTSVAIDGSYILVLAINEGTGSNTYSALLYRRNASDGKWVFRRTLASVTGAFARAELRMKNNVAVVQFGGQVLLFELVNGDYVPAHLATPINHPGGVAISGNRVLVGGDGCTDDAVLYEKGTNGIWSLTGRIDDHAGTCDAYGKTVDLNYDYALLRDQYANTTTAWRRNGTAIDWIPAGTMSPPAGVGSADAPDTLQKATAVQNNGYVYLRSGSSTWTRQGRATSVDRDNANAITFSTVYRDGVLVTCEYGQFISIPHVYVESTPGKFDHVLSLSTSDTADHFDVSGRTVVAVARDSQATRWDVEIFTLPMQLRRPTPIVNDFEDRDASDLEFVSGTFALATRGTNDVLAQSSTGATAIALATQTDWTDYQRVEATFTPTSGTGTSAVGVVARYVDANNYYYASLRANGTFGVHKVVNGVDTVLRESPGYTYRPSRLALEIDGTTVAARIGDEYYFIGTDTSLTHGRAGVATWQARADIDDVYVAGATEYGYFYRDWEPYGSSTDVGLTTLGGNWHVVMDEESNTLGMAQTDLSGEAWAYIGVPVANQQVNAIVRFDGFAASQQGAWVGLLARYIDPQNHYYVTVRSSGQVQIRKIVGGAITVLATANFVPASGRYYEMRFRVINDQLQLFVDGTMVASAHDHDIAKGQYGLATYKAAANFWSLFVEQP